jgi:antitoxin component of MazEF toxin-antitoxin module
MLLLVMCEKAMLSKIQKIGGSMVMPLTPEMLAVLNAQAGDTLYVTCAGDGSLRVVANDPSLEDVLGAGDVVMIENNDLLLGLR